MANKTNRLVGYLLLTVLVGMMVADMVTAVEATTEHLLILSGVITTLILGRRVGSGPPGQGGAGRGGA